MAEMDTEHEEKILVSECLELFTTKTQYFQVGRKFRPILVGGVSGGNLREALMLPWYEAEQR